MRHAKTFLATYILSQLLINSKRDSISGLELPQECCLTNSKVFAKITEAHQSNFPVNLLPKLHKTI